jgi:PilZ domain-containing protein
MSQIGATGPQESDRFPGAADDVDDLWRDPRHRRRFRRYEFSGRVLVSKGGSSNSTWGLCSDLGEGGLGATIVGELAAGDAVWLHLTFPNTNRSIEIRAVVRYRDLHHCGFEFLTLNENQQQAIRESCQIPAHR